MKGFNISLLFCVLMGCLACHQNKEQVYMGALDGHWNKKKSQKFRFEISDATQPKNIIFVVRNNNQYPYSNIRFFVKLQNLKNKTSIQDTLNYEIAAPDGQWLGSGFGDTKEIFFQYKVNYQFPANGTYAISVLHAMRKDDLPGIEDFGIKIEPANQN